MLQPHNGIYISTWYEDPQDTALFTLTPLLEELIQTRARVPDILDKYRDQIPTWAGFDQYSQLSEEYDGPDDGYGLPPAPAQQDVYSGQVERSMPQQDFQQPLRNEVRQPATTSMYTPPPRAEAPQYAPQHQSQLQSAPQPQYEAAPRYVPQAQATSPGQYLQQYSGYPQAQAAGPQRNDARSQPQQQQQQQHQAAPTFSKVAGPYQAQPPQQTQPQATQAVAQGARPANAAMWGRPGIGAHQYVPTRQ